MRDFRCPYCGEPAFSLRIKLGIVSKFGTAPRCWQCKRVAQRCVSRGGSIAYELILCLLAMVSMICMILAVNTGVAVLFPVGLLLLLGGYLVFQYYFCHFDKMCRKDRLADARFCFSSDTTERLWPAVRQGEIYVLQFPGEKRGNAQPCVTGLLDRIDGKSGSRIITVRVIRLQDMGLPEPGEELRLITDGMLVVDGTVLSTEGNT